jgi:hypothetical protein
LYIIIFSIFELIQYTLVITCVIIHDERSEHEQKRECSLCKQRRLLERSGRVCPSANEAKASNQTVPIVPNYIAECFLRISEGLSHKSNFIRYTYREEMVMDAVENCLKAIHNYDLSTATRTGRPNAFAYFTQISWYAFLRRIAKEKKQQDIKLSYLENLT